jgi:hypothetical protein
MADSNPSPQPAAPAAKPRNPVEKLVVRGFILVMLALVAIEGIPKWQHYSAMKTLLTMTKAVDESPDGNAVTKADVEKVLGSKQPIRSGPPEPMKNFNGASRVDVYSWFTFSPVHKREIYVYYGSTSGDEKNGPEVLAVQADDNPPEEPPKIAGDEPMAAPAGAGPGMTPDMMPGMGGGRGGPPAGMRGGRPPTGDADTEKSESEKQDADKSDTEKTDDDKPGQEKPADDKPSDGEGEKDLR